MWSIDAATSALLMIDMQNDFVLEGAPMEVPMARKRLPEMVTAVAACRQAGIPVIYTLHVLLDSFDVSPLETTYNQRLQTVGMRRGTDGVEVVEELKPEADDYVLDKHRYDAFHNTPLKSVLATIRGLNAVDTVIIAGTLTEVCCESTARSAAHMNDYKVAFLSDATGGRSEAARAATLDAVGTFFGRVLSTADMEREIGTTA